jgi:hypothetical protein
VCISRIWSGSRHVIFFAWKLLLAGVANLVVEPVGHVVDAARMWCVACIGRMWCIACVSRHVADAARTWCAACIR